MRVRWSEEQDKVLAEMWLAGIRANHIASRLGMTVSAVRNRAGWKARSDPRYQRFKPRSDDSRRHLIIGSNLLLEPGMCSWIFGEGAKRNLCRCEAVPRRPYCKAHCEIAYEPEVQEI